MKERIKLNSILKGSIHIEPNFFDKDTYKSILKKITTIKIVIPRVTAKTYSLSIISLKYGFTLGNKMRVIT